jgi:hypothetical protein
MAIKEFRPGDLVEIMSLVVEFTPDDVNLFGQKRIDQRKERVKGVIVSKLVGVGSNRWQDFLIVCHCVTDDVAIYSPDELVKLP